MRLDRMDLADTGSPEGLATALLRQMPDLSPPVDVEAIAAALDIIEIRDLETNAFEGGLICLDDRREGCVLLRAGLNRQRRRFTIGHELGHFLNFNHKPTKAEGFRCTQRDLAIQAPRARDRGSEMEAEANRFAALLLLPAPLFVRDLGRLKTVEIEHVPALSKRYDMSKEATARRFVELQDEACAIVISQHGVVRRVYRHKDFPYIALSSGDAVPLGSAAASAAPASGAVTDWREAQSHVWRADAAHGAPHVLMEQSLGQAEGFRMTLLVLPDEDDSDDDGELEESYTPRFRRR